MKPFLILTAMLLIAGCGENNDHQQARLLGGHLPEGKAVSTEFANEKNAKNQTVILEEMKHQNTLDLARIEAEKAKAIGHIELEKSKIETSARQEMAAMAQQTEKEVALAKEQRIAATKDKDIALYQMIMGSGAVLILFGMALFLWIYRKNRNDKLKMHEETLRHEAFMQASRQQHEKMNKMLEIIVDEKADKAVKKELVKLLKEQEGTPALIEYR